MHTVLACRLAWGAAAAAAQAAGGAATGFEALSRLLQSRLALDPLRCALTAVHFPEWRALSGQATSAGAEEPLGGASAAAAVAVAGPPALPHAVAGYDPAFLLPFCVVGLRRRLLPARGLLAAGALSLCLRGLAAADDGLR